MDSGEEWDMESLFRRYHHVERSKALKRNAALIRLKHAFKKRRTAPGSAPESKAAGRVLRSDNNFSLPLTNPDAPRRVQHILSPRRNMSAHAAIQKQIHSAGALLSREVSLLNAGKLHADAPASSIDPPDFSDASTSGSDALLLSPGRGRRKPRRNENTRPQRKNVNAVLETGGEVTAAKGTHEGLGHNSFQTPDTADKKKKDRRKRRQLHEKIRERRRGVLTKVFERYNSHTTSQLLRSISRITGQRLPDRLGGRPEHPPSDQSDGPREPEQRSPPKHVLRAGPRSASVSHSEASAGSSGSESLVSEGRTVSSSDELMASLASASETHVVDSDARSAFELLEGVDASSDSGSSWSLRKSRPSLSALRVSSGSVELPPAPFSDPLRGGERTGPESGGFFSAVPLQGGRASLPRRGRKRTYRIASGQSSSGGSSVSAADASGSEQRLRIRRPPPAATNSAHEERKSVGGQSDSGGAREAKKHQRQTFKYHLTPSGVVVKSPEVETALTLPSSGPAAQLVTDLFQDEVKMVLQKKQDNTGGSLTRKVFPRINSPPSAKLVATPADQDRTPCARSVGSMKFSRAVLSKVFEIGGSAATPSQPRSGTAWIAGYIRSAEQRIRMAQESGALFTSAGFSRDARTGATPGSNLQPILSRILAKSPSSGDVDVGEVGPRTGASRGDSRTDRARSGRPQVSSVRPGSEGGLGETALVKAGGHRNVSSLQRPARSLATSPSFSEDTLLHIRSPAARFDADRLFAIVPSHDKRHMLSRGLRRHKLRQLRDQSEGHTGLVEMSAGDTFQQAVDAVYEHLRQQRAASQQGDALAVTVEVVESAPTKPLFPVERSRMIAPSKRPHIVDAPIRHLFPTPVLGRFSLVEPPDFVMMGDVQMTQRLDAISGLSIVTSSEDELVIMYGRYIRAFPSDIEASKDLTITKLLERREPLNNARRDELQAQWDSEIGACEAHLKSLKQRKAAFKNALLDLRDNKELSAVQMREALMEIYKPWKKLSHEITEVTTKKFAIEEVLMKRSLGLERDLFESDLKAEEKMEGMLRDKDNELLYTFREEVLNEAIAGNRAGALALQDDYLEFKTGLSMLTERRRLARLQESRLRRRQHESEQDALLAAMRRDHQRRRKAELDRQQEEYRELEALHEAERLAMEERLRAEEAEMRARLEARMRRRNQDQVNVGLVDEFQVVLSTSTDSVTRFKIDKILEIRALVRRRRAERRLAHKQELALRKAKRRAERARLLAEAEAYKTMSDEEKRRLRAEEDAQLLALKHAREQAELEAKQKALLERLRNSKDQSLTMGVLVEYEHELEDEHHEKTMEDRRMRYLKEQRDALLFRQTARRNKRRALRMVARERRKLRRRHKQQRLTEKQKRNDKYQAELDAMLVRKMRIPRSKWAEMGPVLVREELESRHSREDEALKKRIREHRAVCIKEVVVKTDVTPEEAEAKLEGDLHGFGEFCHQQNEKRRDEEVAYFLKKVFPKENDIRDRKKIRLYLDRDDVHLINNPMDPKFVTDDHLDAWLERCEGVDNVLSTLSQLNTFEEHFHGPESLTLGLESLEATKEDLLSKLKMEDDEKTYKMLLKCERPLPSELEIKHMNRLFDDTAVDSVNTLIKYLEYFRDSRKRYETYNELVGDVYRRHEKYLLGFEAVYGFLQNESEFFDQAERNGLQVEVERPDLEVMLELFDLNRKEVVDEMHLFNDAAMQFDNVNQLISILESCKEDKRKITEFMKSPMCDLFFQPGDPACRVTKRNVDLLYAFGGAGRNTLSRLKEFNQIHHKFSSFEELIQGLMANYVNLPGADEEEVDIINLDDDVIEKAQVADYTLDIMASYLNNCDLFPYHQEPLKVNGVMLTKLLLVGGGLSSTMAHINNLSTMGNGFHSVEELIESVNELNHTISAAEEERLDKEMSSVTSALTHLPEEEKLAKMKEQAARRRKATQTDLQRKAEEARMKQDESASFRNVMRETVLTYLSSSECYLFHTLDALGVRGNQIDQLIADCGGLTRLLELLQQLNAMEQHFYSWDVMAKAVTALSRGKEHFYDFAEEQAVEENADEESILRRVNSVIAYLHSDDCTLFRFASNSVSITEEDLVEMLEVFDWEEGALIAVLEEMDDNDRTFSSCKSLIKALRKKKKAMQGDGKCAIM